MRPGADNTVFEALDLQRRTQTPHNQNASERQTTLCLLLTRLLFYTILHFGLPNYQAEGTHKHNISLSTKRKSQCAVRGADHQRTHPVYRKLIKSSPYLSISPCNQRQRSWFNSVVREKALQRATRKCECQRSLLEIVSRGNNRHLSQKWTWYLH
jgi:hypothetical protein